MSSHADILFVYGMVNGRVAVTSKGRYLTKAYLSDGVVAVGKVGVIADYESSFITK